jgi:hypothetical protein
MKKQIILVIVFCLISWQRAYSQVTTLGVHGSIGNVKVTNNVFDEAVIGWNAGIGVGYRINTHFTIVSELNYESKGSKGELFVSTEVAPDLLIPAAYKLQLNYLTIPAMIRYTIGQKRLHGFVNAGGYYGFMASASLNAQGKELRSLVTQNYRRNDLGLAFGAGGSFDLSEHYSISLEWRNHYGLRDVSTSATNQFNRSNFMQVTLQYQLN